MKFYKRMRRSLFLSGFVFLLASCGSMKPVDFRKTGPRFDLLTFYTGHTRSTGIIESRSGKPMKRVATETWGRMIDGTLQMTQDITLDENNPERRVWTIRRLDEHHYEGRTPSVIGTARGVAYGSALRFDYVLQLKPGNPLSRVRMTHWMILQPDGHTMLNRVTVRKAGVSIAQISEVFQQVRE